MSSRVERFTSRVVRRREKLATLSEAIFGSRPVAYARRRLLFPVSRTGLMAFFHALEAAALLLIFDPRLLIPIISLRLGASLASGAIWGATETLRQDLRLIGGNAQRQESIARIEEALARACVLGLLVVMASVAWVWRYPYVGPGYFSVIDAYVIALGLRVGISWVSRTYHSGLLAKQRVFRPRWSLLVPDLMDGLGLFIFWRVAGPWSIAIAVVGSSLLHALLSLIFSKRAYVDQGMAAPGFFHFGRLSPPSLELSKRWILSLCVGLSCEIPSLLVLGHWHSLGGGADITVAMLLYWARPFASFLSSIPRIYYVDLVRVRTLGGLGKGRLHRYLTITILVLGGGLITLCTIGAVAFASLYGALYLALYLVLATFLALLTLAAVIFMIGPVAQREGDSLALVPFLSRVESSSEQCEVMVLELARKQSGRVAQALVSNLERLPGVRASRLGRRYLLCHCTQRQSRSLRLEACGGVATPIAHSAWSSSGRAALAAIVDAEHFPEELRQWLDGAATIEKFEAYLLARAPSALVLRGNNLRRSRAKPGTIGDLQHVLRQFQGAFTPASFCWGQAGRPLLISRGGQPQWLALLPMDTPAAEVAELRRQAWRLGVCDAWFGNTDLKILPKSNTLADEKEA